MSETSPEFFTAEDEPSWSYMVLQQQKSAYPGVGLDETFILHFGGFHLKTMTAAEILNLYDAGGVFRSSKWVFPKVMVSPNHPF